MFPLAILVVITSVNILILFSLNLLVKSYKEKCVFERYFQK